MPSSTRDRLLDAFQDLLIDRGERAATLDAVAAAAGVSKGGLLYHFGSKDTLVDGQLERLRRLALADADAIRTAPGGAVDYLIRTSVETGTPIDRAILATACLAQGNHPSAKNALAAIRREWLAVVEEVVGDHTVAQLILLVSDGLYYNAALADVGHIDPANDPAADLDGLLTVIRRLTD